MLYWTPKILFTVLRTSLTCFALISTELISIQNKASFSWNMLYLNAFDSNSQSKLFVMKAANAKKRFVSQSEDSYLSFHTQLRTNLNCAVEIEWPKRCYRYRSFYIINCLRNTYWKAPVPTLQFVYGLQECNQKYWGLSIFTCTFEICDNRLVCCLKMM